MDLNNFEREIVHQILICEVCFSICKSIPIIPGRGSDFLPFYYNLNFSKGAISLHSLLLSKANNELSLKNFIKLYKTKKPTEDIRDFETEIAVVEKSLEILFPEQLRHKVFAHIDSGYKHTDSTCAYMLPNSVDDYLSIIQNLKKTFFTFGNHSLNDSYNMIYRQSDAVIKFLLQKSNSEYQL